MQDSNQVQEQNQKKLFVGNLSFGVTQDGLRGLFEEFGELTDAVLITDKFSGRSKGFGFVEFVEEASAQAAVEAMNEAEVEGRKLIVNVARPKQPRDDSRGGYRPRGGSGGGRPSYGRDNSRSY
jgi:RNA recognition motif-containing protein